MPVIRANALGMCFGVRDALQAMRAIDAPRDVTIHGELVHNEVVLHQLRVRGFGMVGEADRDALPATPRVLVTAHGVSDRERRRITDAGKALIDTTCPLVRRVHAAALKFAADGFHLIVIGKPGHVEVRGVVEDVPAHDVVPAVDAVRTYGASRLGVICQSTTPPELAADVLAEVRRLNPHAEVRFTDTICRPTRDHQRALTDLLPLVEAVVVVGGRNSNNTAELARRVADAGLPACHVVGPGELDAGWVTRFGRVGLTAGTSTLPETVDAVERRLDEMLTAAESSGACRIRTGNQSVMSGLL